MIRRPPRSTLFPLHDALPIWLRRSSLLPRRVLHAVRRVGHKTKTLVRDRLTAVDAGPVRAGFQPTECVIDLTQPGRSEEHTSELQSPCNLVCRLLLEKKQIITVDTINLLMAPTFFIHFLTPRPTIFTIFSSARISDEAIIAKFMISTSAASPAINAQP